MKTHYGIITLLKKDSVWLCVQNRTASNPITKKEISKKTGINPQIIKHIVVHLIIDGKPIIKGHKGYYIARSPEEFDPMLAYCRKQIQIYSMQLKKFLELQRELLPQRN